MRILHSLLLALPLALTACAGPIPAQQDKVGDYGQVRLNSYYLQQNTKVQPPVVNRTGAGQLEVTIPIRNQTDQEMIVDAQARFFNPDGTQAELTGWQEVRIPRKGIAQIHFVSMTPAADFDVQVRSRR